MSRVPTKEVETCSDCGGRFQKDLMGMVGGPHSDLEYLCPLCFRKALPDPDLLDIADHLENFIETLDADLYAKTRFYGREIAKLMRQRTVQEVGKECHEPAARKGPGLGQ